MTVAYIGLGANLSDPAKQIRRALRRLDERPGLQVTKYSSFYRSAPLGPAGQDDYCNAVAQLESELDAQSLLEELKSIERALGRKPGAQRWGARLIDLDLLLFADELITQPGLTVPHAEIGKRNFVLIPLAEIAPAAIIPGLGSAHELADAIGCNGLELWEPEP